MTFITGNQNKADFLAKHLGVEITHQNLDLEEIQSLNLHEVVQRKAEEAYRKIKQPVIVEDVSLIFTAMGRLPGTFIKWFEQELGLEGLVELADSQPRRDAIGRVCYGLHDGAGIRYFDGEMRGTIATRVGDKAHGFGFDPIFINDTYAVPRSEMGEADYYNTSYRTSALKTYVML